MTKKKSSGNGLMSSAGLMRYYDADDKRALKISPKIIMVAGLLIGVGILMLEISFGRWPLP